MTVITIMIPLFVVLTLLMVFIVIQEREITHYRKAMITQEKVIFDMVIQQTINEQQKQRQEEKD
jgi:uncharacterized membrane protein (GlpM family)